MMIPSSWDGVEYDEDSGHVIVLELRSSYLSRSINSSSSLFHLVHLHRLDLSAVLSTVSPPSLKKKKKNPKTKKSIFFFN
ncbi:hypothetical protein CerSpe_238110 [Prunus speciosa]